MGRPFLIFHEWIKIFFSSLMFYAHLNVSLAIKLQKLRENSCVDIWIAYVNRLESSSLFLSEIYMSDYVIYHCFTLICLFLLISNFPFLFVISKWIINRKYIMSSFLCLQNFSDLLKYKQIICFFCSFTI